MELPKKKIIRDKGLYREYGEEHYQCEVPGCSEEGWLGPHHIVFRSQGGGDTLDNLIQLCRRHHEWAHGEHSRKARKFFQTIKSQLIYRASTEAEDDAEG